MNTTDQTPALEADVEILFRDESDNRLFVVYRQHGKDPNLIIADKDRGDIVNTKVSNLLWIMKRLIEKGIV